MKKTILVLAAVATLTLASCNEKPSRKQQTTTEQTAGAPAQATTEETSDSVNAPAASPAKPAGATATPVTPAKPKTPPTAAEMKKLGLTGDIQADVKTVVTAIVNGSDALKNGKDPKQVNNDTQELLMAAAAYYESKGKLSEFNELRDEVMKEELSKRLLEQKK